MSSLNGDAPSTPIRSDEGTLVPGYNKEELLVLISQSVQAAVMSVLPGLKTQLVEEIRVRELDHTVLKTPNGRAQESGSPVSGMAPSNGGITERNGTVRDWEEVNVLLNFAKSIRNTSSAMPRVCPLLIALAITLWKIFRGSTLSSQCLHRV